MSWNVLSVHERILHPYSSLVRSCDSIGFAAYSKGLPDDLLKLLSDCIAMSCNALQKDFHRIPRDSRIHVLRFPLDQDSFKIPKGFRAQICLSPLPTSRALQAPQLQRVAGHCTPLRGFARKPSETLSNIKEIPNETLWIYANPLASQGILKTSLKY